MLPQRLRPAPLCTLLFVSLAASAPAHEYVAPFNWHNMRYVLAFGDSYTWVQGTLGYPGYTFIGDFLPQDFAYTPGQLLEDKIVQNFSGTAEGGPNWVEYITGCAVDNGVVSPSSCGVQLWDFAVAGADVSEEFTPPHHNFTTPLVNQTQEYLKYGDAVLRKQVFMTPQTTLVAEWIGINDISDSVNYNVSFPEFYEEIISAQFNESVIPLYHAGYRYFLFMNLPPLDRTPPNVGSANPSPSKAQIDLWDATLASYSRVFTREHPDALSMLFDANKFLNGVLDHPSAYGIKNTTDYCTGYTDPDVLTDPGKYGCLPLDELFWFNTGHMTSHTHKIMSEAVLDFLQEQSCC